MTRGRWDGSPCTPDGFSLDRAGILPSVSSIAYSLVRTAAIWGVAWKRTWDFTVAANDKQVAKAVAVPGGASGVDEVPVGLVGSKGAGRHYRPQPDQQPGPAQRRAPRFDPTSSGCAR
jgi:hypothetical protein